MGRDQAAEVGGMWGAPAPWGSPAHVPMFGWPPAWGSRQNASPSGSWSAPWDHALFQGQGFAPPWGTPSQPVYDVCAAHLAIGKDSSGERAAAGVPPTPPAPWAPGSAAGHFAGAVEATKQRRQRRRRGQAKSKGVEEPAAAAGNADEGVHPAAALIAQLGDRSSEAHRAAMGELRAAFAGLAFDARGCRVAQDALERLGNDEKKELALQLRGRIREALADKHANYVVQKMVEAMPTAAVQFIVDELRGFAVRTAQHRYGVRILCRLLEHCPHQQTEPLTAELLGEASLLCRHSYGNYAIQHILEHGTHGERQAALRVLMSDASGFATHRTGSSVTEAALSNSPQEDRRALQQELMRDAGAFRDLACSRYGSYVALFLLQGAPCRSLAESWLPDMQPALAESKYGRKILAELSHPSP